MVDRFECFGLHEGGCGKVHASLGTAALCLAAHIRARSNTDRRIFKLVGGKRKSLTAAEHDQAYEIWKAACG